VGFESWRNKHALAMTFQDEHDEVFHGFLKHDEWKNQKQDVDLSIFEDKEPKERAKIPRELVTGYSPYADAILLGKEKVKKIQDDCRGYSTWAQQEALNQKIIW